MLRYSYSSFVLLLHWLIIASCSPTHVVHTTNNVSVGPGWAGNSINVVSFRKNALTSFGEMQFIAYYDSSGNVIAGSRRHDSVSWRLVNTGFVGNIHDAHNAISIAVDGEGFIHLSWDHHNTRLNYARSVSPLTLQFSAGTMIGRDENRVTYPEFHRLKNGDLIFAYRNGESGNGKLVLNRYLVKNKQWQRLHDNLIDGEEQRNAYWQGYVDNKGGFHLSWVWRESADVASNHDMCYARSYDGGETWTDSKGRIYTLPINAANAEYAWRIPQSSELINQTSMAADDDGNPFIATYWRAPDDSIPQYQLLWNINGGWNHQPLNFRRTSFSLSGTGTKRIPIARPKIAVTGRLEDISVILLFRDEERQSRVSACVTTIRNTNKPVILDLNSFSVGSWEPLFDIERWNSSKELHLFVQPVDQVDGEGLSQQNSTMVTVVEWTPFVR